MSATTQIPFIPAQTTLKPGERLVPAVLQGATIYVSEPSWCDVDHVKTYVTFLDDIGHQSAGFDVELPKVNGGYEQAFHISLHSSPYTHDDAVKVYLDDGNEGYEMDRTQALKAAADLRAAADHIEALAALADEVSA